MEVVLKRARSGDVLVVVRFGEDSNFDKEKMEWCPRLDELDLVIDAKKMIIDAQGKKKTGGS